ncbi:MAG: alpha/beta fold hydrolase, partial [Anaerolineae bacterium]|nr:alpha/beta fold hydrolase [Anaerolineae bacterium]
VGFAATMPLMRRRDPDPIDDPASHGMPGQAVLFPSRDTTILGGWWIPTLENPRGTIIMCPGQNGSLDKDMPQAVPLHQAGFNVLMFDFRGHGRSEGQIVTIGALEQADLFGAVDYVTVKHKADRIGVLGFSMGAGVALMVAAQDQRIKTLVVDGAYPRLSGLLANYMRINGIPRLLGDVMAWLVLIVGSLRTQYQLFRANPADLADRIMAPTLFIHGDDDPFLTPEEIEALVAQIPGETDLWCVAEAGHRDAYTNHPDEYNRRVVAWFEQHLEG